MSAAAAPVPALGKITTLMKQCGSKNGRFGPEALEQWRWMMRNGTGKERLLALIKLRSVGRGSPYCVGEDGAPLRIESLAAELGWAVKTARNCCSALAEEGRIRLKKSHVWYAADVPDSAPVQPATEEEDEDDLSFVHRNFAGYVIDFYERQPEDRKPALASQMRQLVGWRMQVMREGIADLRTEVARVELNTYAQWGAPKIVLPKNERPPSQWTQLKLVSEPSFVQGKNDEPVDKGSYRRKNGRVQSEKLAASLISLEETIDTEPASQPVVLTEARPAGRPTPEPEPEPNREADVKAALVYEYGERFPWEPVEPEFCRRIVAALQGAPVEHLRAKMKQRRLAKIDGLGFALTLAKEVGKAWRDKESGRRPASPPVLSNEEREAHARCLQQAHKVLADPDAPEYEKRDAREFLELHGELTKQAGT